jgi:hypothetical protein
MPFTSYTTVLDPYDLAAAQQAFDKAWAEVSAVPGGYDLQLARDLIAKRVVTGITTTGDRDPEKLKAYALEGFNP